MARRPGSATRSRRRPVETFLAASLAARPGRPPPRADARRAGLPVTPGACGWPASPPDCGCGSVAETPPGAAGPDAQALGHVGFASGIGALLAAADVVALRVRPGLWRVSDQASIIRMATAAAT
ncbi:MAG: hypothetical protein ACXV5Q_14520, partial [Frankiaceae bacterium]